MNAFTQQQKERIKILTSFLFKILGKKIVKIQDIIIILMRETKKDTNQSNNVLGIFPHQQTSSVFSNNKSQNFSVFSNPGLLNQGFSQEVQSFMNNQTQPQPQPQHLREFFSDVQKPKQPMARHTKLFLEQHYPFRISKQMIMKLFSQEQIQKNTFKFPENIDHIINLPQVQPQTNKYFFNACMMPKIETYYVCHNCQRTQQQEIDFEFVICQRCFQPDLHIGHFYQKFAKPQNYYLRICICGKDAFLNNPPVYRCRKHCQPRQKQTIGIQLKQKQQQIITIFRQLFQIAFYMQKQMGNFKNLQKKQTINYLNFILLVFMKMFKAINADACIMFPLFNLVNSQKYMLYNERYQQQRVFFSTQKEMTILQYMTSSLANQFISMALLLKFMSNDEICKAVVNVNISSQRVKKQLSLRINVLLSKKQKGKYFQPKYNSEKNQRIIWLASQKNYKYAIDYIILKAYKIQPSNYKNKKIVYLQSMTSILEAFDGIPICKFLKNICLYLLPALLGCYKRIFDKSIQQFQLSDEEDQMQYQEHEFQYHFQKMRQLKDYWSKNHQIVGVINRLLISLCDGQLINLATLDQNLWQLQKQYCSNKLQQMVPNLKGSQQQFFNQTKNIGLNFRFFYRNICQRYISIQEKRNFSRNQRGYQDQIKKLNQIQELNLTYLVFIYFSRCPIFEQYNLGEDPFRRNLDRPKIKIIAYLKLIRDYDLLTILLFAKFHVRQIWNNEFRTAQNIEHDEQQVQRILINYFGVQKAFSPYNLKILQKRLKIRNFRNIVRQNLAYDLATKKFYYKEQNGFPNNIYRLLQTKMPEDIEKLINLQSIIEAKKYMNNPIRQLFKNLMDDSNQIKEFLTQKSNQSLEKLLQQQKNSSQFGLSIMNTQQNKVNQLPSKQQKNEAQKQSIQSVNKQKMKQIQQKANKILNSVPLSDNKSEVCMICHQNSQIGNKFVYLMKCNINKTVSSSFFMDSNKMRTNLRICFHPLHIKCYYKQKQLYRNCPLCAKFTNCIIPVTYEKQQAQLNRLCLNSLIVAMYEHYKVFDVGNYFIIIFKHLIESKVFNSLINLQLYQQNKRKKEKSEKFLESYLQQMYKQASLETKAEYDKNISELLNECLQVQQKTLGQIQIIFLKALANKIMGNEVGLSADQFQKMAIKMRKQDFMVIMSEAKQLQQNSLPYEQLQKISQNNGQEAQKLSRQYPLALPKDIRDLTKLKADVCSFCSRSQNPGICLICGCRLCSYCLSSEGHSRQHQQKALNFLFTEAKVSFNLSMSKEESQIWNSNNQKNIPLYYNELMIPYRQVLKLKPLEMDEQINLNQKLYFGLAEMLLS